MNHGKCLIAEYGKCLISMIKKMLTKNNFYYIYTMLDKIIITIITQNQYYF